MILDPLAPGDAAISPVYAAALTSSHEVYFEAEWKHWDEADTAYRPLQSLPGLVVVDGAVNLTRGSLVTRTGRLDLGGWDAVPKVDFSGPISPHSRYRLWRGVRLGDGSYHRTLLGTFMASRIRTLRTASGVQVVLELADEMKQVDLNPLPAPLGVAGTVTVKNVLRWLLTDLTNWSARKAAGDVEYAEYDSSGVILTTNITPTFTHPGTGAVLKPTPNWVTSGPYEVEEEETTLLDDSDFSGSRVSVVESLMDTANVSVFLDEYGNPQVTRRLVTLDESVWNEAALAAAGYITWTFDGGVGGSLIERTPEWDISQVVNETHVVSGDFSSRRRITTGALSPSELGMVLTYYEDVSAEPFSETLSALRSYSKRVSREKLGAARTLSVSSLVIPFLKPGHIVKVADMGPTGVDGYELLIVDEVTIPFNAKEPMTMAARKLDIDTFVA